MEKKLLLGEKKIIHRFGENFGKHIADKSTGIKKLQISLKIQELENNPI